MKINGKERHFKLTVGAYFEIAKHCPNGNINQIDDMLNGDENKAFDFIIKMAVAMNNGYNQQCKYTGEEAEEDCLTYAELSTLSPFEIPGLAFEILDNFKKGQQTEIELKPKKKEQEA